MQGERTTSFAVAGTTCFGPFHVAVVSAGGRAVIPERNNAGVFCKHCSYFNFYAMAFMGKVLRQVHVDFIEGGAVHSARKGKKGKYSLSLKFLFPNHK